MYLLLALGLGALYVIFERILFFRKHQVDIDLLARELDKALSSGDRASALAMAKSQPSMETSVMAAGITAMERGAGAVEEMAQSRLVTARVAYDRHLPFLGTLGNNAPFIGLFGTVLGIISAFDQLKTAGQGANRMNAIMGSIAEALVATAVGLLVAIPSVIAYNQFKGIIKERTARTDALTRVLLAHLKDTSHASNDSEPS